MTGLGRSRLPKLATTSHLPACCYTDVQADQNGPELCNLGRHGHHLRKCRRGRCDAQLHGWYAKASRRMSAGMYSLEVSYNWSGTVTPS